MQRLRNAARFNPIQLRGLRMNQDQKERLEVSGNIVEQLQGMVRESAELANALGPQSPGPGPAPDHNRRDAE